MEDFQIIKNCLQNHKFQLESTRNEIVILPQELPQWFRASLPLFDDLLKDLGQGLTTESKQFDDGNENDSGTRGLGVLDMMEDFVWEQLNTGHWKCVPLHWRKLYSLLKLIRVIYLSKQPSTVTSDLIDLIKQCDLGLLMGDPTVGGGALTIIATQLHKRQTQEQGFIETPNDDSIDFSLLDRIYEIPKLNSILVQTYKRPSVQFFSNNFQSKFPTVITHAIDHWPASTRWSPGYIKHVCGSRTVPVEIGSKYTAEDWTQKLMTISDFVDEFMKPSTDPPSAPRRIGYVAQHTLFDQIPELREDIRVPDYCSVGKSEHVEMNAWFGPAATLTPAHYDPKHNLLAQVFGTKFVRLYTPIMGRKCLVPHEEGSLLFNTSQVDMEDPLVLAKHPQLLNLPYVDILLTPGTLLYIPPQWWHMVKSLSPSFSVSFWFE